MKSVHQGVRYKCQICEHKAATKCALYEHIQIKHKGKKYQCQSCEKIYTRRDSLLKHTQSKHEGVTYVNFHPRIEGWVRSEMQKLSKQ